MQRINDSIAPNLRKKALANRKFNHKKIKQGNGKVHLFRKR
nr:MAG TPA: hypothetical protein [Caudoviricetes sp.]